MARVPFIFQLPTMKGRLGIWIPSLNKNFPLDRRAQTRA